MSTVKINRDVRDSKYIALERPTIKLDIVKKVGNKTEPGKNVKVIDIPTKLDNEKKLTTYDSSGKTISKGNSNSNYTATVNTDNRVTQKTTPPYKDAAKDPFETAKEINKGIKDALDVKKIIQAHQDNFGLVNDDGYVNIKGARTGTTDELGIQGTRYKKDNLANHPNVDKLVNPATAAKEAIRNTDGFSLLDTGLGVAQNIANDAKASKTMSDAVVDFAMNKAGDVIAATTAAAVTAGSLAASNQLSGETKLVTATAMVTGVLSAKMFDNLNKLTKLPDKLKSGLGGVIDSIAESVKNATETTKKGTLPGRPSTDAVSGVNGGLSSIKSKDSTSGLKDALSPLINLGGKSEKSGNSQSSGSTGSKSNGTVSGVNGGLSSVGSSSSSKSSSSTSSSSSKPSSSSSGSVSGVSGGLSSIGSSSSSSKSSSSTSSSKTNSTSSSSSKASSSGGTKPSGKGHLYE